jgi:GT2 family glycosyltransferase
MTLAEERLRTLIVASGLFDADFYAEQYPDVVRGGFDPVIHYIRYGATERRNPSAAFDAAQYLAEYPDVRDANMNPLLHFILHGRTEGRKIRRAAVRAPAPKAPRDDEWEMLTASITTEAQERPTVDVIIPVYRGFDETANCLYSVLRSRLSAKVACEVVVVDDHSPEPELSYLLERLAGLGLCTLLRNAQNEGFVVSVNRGMELHSDRDVILLNSDTEVYGDWVERLHRAVYSDNIGTATPFSNNATICSYPNFPGEFHGLLEISFDELDQLTSKANAGLTVDLPTAVGFCMYIRRQCLDEVGLFDAKAFGRGYGEENDFCLRIAARGWRNVLAGDVFVRHLGRVSFDSTNARIRQALEILNVRHPNYLRDVAKFISYDPAQPLRSNLDAVRLRRAAGGRPFLFVLHDLDGGTRRHVLEVAALLAEEGIGSLLLQPCQGDGQYAEISVPLVENFGRVSSIDIQHDLPGAVALFRAIGVAHIHVHHLQGFALEAVHFFQALAEGCRIQYDVTLHDYLTICPRVTMIDSSGAYCGNHSLAICERCVKSAGSPFGNVSVWLWRSTHERFLRGARKVFVPDEDVQQRMRTFLPSVPITVRPHPEPVPTIFAERVMRRHNEVLRVAVIGAIGPHKGSLQLQRCAEDAARRRLPIKFILFGFTDRSEISGLPTVEMTGRYTEQHLPKLLERSRCHLSFFPSVWPETYSYTLSQAFFSGLYPVAFDIGAIARRIREADWGLLLPFELLDQPRKINEALLACQVPPMPDTVVVKGANRYRDILSDYYELDSRAFGGRRPSAPTPIEAVGTGNNGVL